VFLKFNGYGFFTVKTGSMTDVYPIGTVIIVQPTDFEDISVNDVISFYLGESSVVTHRVVDIDTTNRTFTTKGDQNNTEDSTPVPYENVIGVPIFSIEKLGYLYMFFNTTKGKVVLGGIVVLIVLSGVYSAHSRKE
jgi:signal peptidase